VSAEGAPRKDGGAGEEPAKRWLGGTGAGRCGASSRAGVPPPEILASSFGRSLDVDELLVELAEARFDFLKIVGQTLDLGRHGVQARPELA